jgi:hypothetical protein
MDGHLQAPHQLRRIEAAALCWCICIHGRRTELVCSNSALLCRWYGCRPQGSTLHSRECSDKAAQLPPRSRWGLRRRWTRRSFPSWWGLRWSWTCRRICVWRPRQRPRRGCGSARASCRWTPSCQGGDGAAEGNDSAEEEDVICASSQIIFRKHGRGQCRQAHFFQFSVRFEYLCTSST